MRLLMTADAVGGVWPYALELARALAPHGVEAHVATMGPRPTDRQRADAARAGVALHEGDYALEWMDAPWDDVARAGDWLLGLARARAPDVVQVNGYAHGALPWGAPAVVVAHSDVCSWWEAVRGEPAPASWDRYRAAVAAGLAGADAVVAPTRATAESLARHYEIAAERVRVVPNARRADDYPPAAKEPIVLTAGRLWDDAKNVAAVARAADATPWVAYVAGDAASPDGRAVEWGGAAASVRWLGPLAPAELAAWMGRAAVYALPARYEPFGLSALEAGLAGCALVLGDLPSLREVWGDAALYVAPDDATRLAAVLRTLAADDGYRAALGARARARALTYTPERTAAGYLAAYAAAARSGRCQVAPEAVS
ncbi:glycosyl transferase [Gemmatimonadetes bacterium T265]|nr:glycosyl transferase [Gemmatimonadetes bacterium T265]